MRFLILKNVDSLLNNNVKYLTQKDVTPTYYPKRTPEDSLIDWNLDIYKLDKFIRAVTKPFNGAFTFIKKKKLIIYNAQIFDSFDFDYSESNNGAVLEVFNSQKFLVKCNGGVLLVNEYVCSFKIIKGHVFNNNNLEIKTFPINNQGFFDI